jgi:O-antigen ligase
VSPAYLVVAALAWAVASDGGTGARDLVIVGVALAAAALACRAWRAADPASTAAAAALLVWLVATGPARAGVTLESVRVPALVVVATLAVLVIARLPATDRETVTHGVIAIGCLQAVVALTEVLTSTASVLSAPPRADALLGSPNGLGMLLVATCVLTVRRIMTSGGWLPVAALVLQVCGLLATSSRTAIVIACALLVWYAATRGDWRVRSAAAVVAAVGSGLVLWRFTTEPVEQRPHLFLEALGRIADHPLWGAGPTGTPYSSSAPTARVTTHAHNELLQWGVEFGLVAVVLGLMAVVLALRAARRPVRPDPWVVVAALVVLAAGLIDFTLRITAMSVAAAVLATLAATESSTSHRVRSAPPSRTGGCRESTGSSASATSRGSGRPAGSRSRPAYRTFATSGGTPSGSSYGSSYVCGSSSSPEAPSKAR